MEDIPPATLEEYKHAFTLIDKNKDGAIAPEELKSVMDAIGQPVTEEEVQKMINDADLDSNGKVDLAEFAKMMKKRAKNNELMAAFQNFDSDGSGKISGEELKQALTSIGEDITDDQLVKMIKEADKDGDGQVDYEEFLKMMAT